MSCQGPSGPTQDQSGIELTYEQYVKLLISAASNYDEQFVPKDRHAAPALRRTVYAHEVTDFDADVIDAIDSEYDIDIGIDTIQANVTNQHPAGSHMPFGHWKSLPPETQAIWDTIPDKNKATILGTVRGPSSASGSLRAPLVHNSIVRVTPSVFRRVPDLGGSLCDISPVGAYVCEHASFTFFSIQSWILLC
jgi:hypothetical protein